MKKRIKLHVFCVCLMALLGSCVKQEILKLATTTSLYDSGLLDHIVPDFEKEYKVKVNIISVGTGKALKLGENGDVDLLLVHAPEAEKAFVEKEFGIDRITFMYNYFIFVGPENDPAEIGELTEIRDVMKSFAGGEAMFISRGDDSGTHKKEKALWKLINIMPEGDWYMEAGQGMGATLYIADVKQAYTLSDKATFLSFQAKLKLKEFVIDESLRNPYSVMAINPIKHSHVKYKLSRQFIDWISTHKVLDKIGDFRQNGRKLFTPVFVRNK